MLSKKAAALILKVLFSCVERCFIARGLTIGGLSIHFNVGRSGSILHQSILNVVHLLAKL